MAKVMTGFEHVTTMPKFKRCKVSAIRDFLPGCGRGATTDFGLNRQITVDQGKPLFGFEKEWLSERGEKKKKIDEGVFGHQ
ncbi:hypothetical protein J1N35_034210 [Gossypium stocksii]|uniref:Uncharacterized protein n=1 Tax=Gossypium stocksii TaxID=47602 RepID=A0A9D3URL5_9ROSI|nr:hypothetical protein J1N35_034210 [Gossypium stocksii]